MLNGPTLEMKSDVGEVGDYPDRCLTSAQMIGDEVGCDWLAAMAVSQTTDALNSNSSKVFLHSAPPNFEIGLRHAPKHTPAVQLTPQTKIVHTTAGDRQRRVFLQVLFWWGPCVELARAFCFRSLPHHASRPSRLNSAAFHPNLICTAFPAKPSLRL